MYPILAFKMQFIEFFYSLYFQILLKNQYFRAEPLEDMDMIEADGKLQLITECWVEPQCGTIVDSPEGRGLFDGQQYMNVPDLVSG